ncbi:hypothetical protein SMG44B_10223 [Stenotrophomonas maltophilia]
MLATGWSGRLAPKAGWCPVQRCQHAQACRRAFALATLASRRTCIIATPRRSHPGRVRCHAMVLAGRTAVGRRGERQRRCIQHQGNKQHPSQYEARQVHPPMIADAQLHSMGWQRPRPPGSHAADLRDGPCYGEMAIVAHCLAMPLSLTRSFPHEWTHANTACDAVVVVRDHRPRRCIR